MLRSIAMFLGIACLTACAGAPVQEMSDARQAIAAARVAGATDNSSTEFYAAEAAIARAEKHLEAQEYTRARLAAMEAKHHAGAAQAATQRSEGAGGTTKPPGAVVLPPGAALQPVSIVPVSPTH